jgi:hypothetical protein
VAQALESTRDHEDIAGKRNPLYEMGAKSKGLERPLFEPSTMNCGAYRSLFARGNHLQMEKSIELFAE